MEIKQKKNGRGSKGFKKGGPPGPGRKSNKTKLNPVIDFLREALRDQLPEDIIFRLAGNLISKNSTIFLNSLKLLLTMAPPRRGTILSPHILTILQNYLEDTVFADSEVIPDISNEPDEAKT